MTYNVSVTVSRADLPGAELTANVEVDGKDVIDPLVLAMIAKLEKALASDKMPELLPRVR